MTHFDPGAYYKGNIQKVWDEIKLIPDNDVPVWADEIIADIEAREKLENFETVRNPKAIDDLLYAIASQLLILHETKDLDTIEGTDKRQRAIERLQEEQNILMLKAELLRRKDATIRLPLNIPKRGSRRMDTRIIWSSRKRSPVELLKRFSGEISVPNYLSLETVVRAHFFIPSAPTPLLPGFPSRLRWLGDLKVLALLFEALANRNYTRKQQLKNVALHFVDKNGLEINPESFMTLVYKESNDSNIKVEKLINIFEKTS